MIIIFNFIYKNVINALNINISQIILNLLIFNHIIHKNFNKGDCIIKIEADKSLSLCLPRSIILLYFFSTTLAKFSILFIETSTVSALDFYYFLFIFGFHYLINTSMLLTTSLIISPLASLKGFKSYTCILISKFKYIYNIIQQNSIFFH